MRTKFIKLNQFISVFVFLALIVGLAVPSVSAQALFLTTTVLVEKLQPTWGTPGDGGGGVYAAYYTGPYEARTVVSPGVTSFFDGRVGGIIKAGFTTAEPWDEGILAFKVPNVSLSAFAGQTLTYDCREPGGCEPGLGSNPAD